MLSKLLKNFSRSESGAVTVDWVVLTAAIVGIGLAVGFPVFVATQDRADTMEQQIKDLPLGQNN